MRAGTQAAIQEVNPTPSALDIELLAIDLNSCTRCVGTLDHIEKAIDLVRPVLEVMDVQVEVRKTVVENEAQARQLEFAISPTVRIDGRDIAFETMESHCDTCTDLCGCDEGTNCRIWPYRGKEYTEAPVGLVVESVLREVLGESSRSAAPAPNYQGVPDNLRRFFDTKLGKPVDGEACCSPAEQEGCCEPAEKSACCDETEPQSCGCQ